MNTINNFQNIRQHKRKDTEKTKRAVARNKTMMRRQPVGQHMDPAF